MLVHRILSFLGISQADASEDHESPVRMDERAALARCEHLIFALHGVAKNRQKYAEWDERWRLSMLPIYDDVGRLVTSLLASGGRLHWHGLNLEYESTLRSGDGDADGRKKQETFNAMNRSYEYLLLRMKPDLIKRIYG